MSFVSGYPGSILIPKIVHVREELTYTESNYFQWEDISLHALTYCIYRHTIPIIDVKENHKKHKS